MAFAEEKIASCVQGEFGHNDCKKQKTFRIISIFHF